MARIKARTSFKPAQQIFQMQPDALVNMSGGTPPGSGVKYEWSTDGSVANAIGTQKNVRIISMLVNVTWSGQPDPLEIHGTIDGVAYKWTFTPNPASATNYFARLDAGVAENAQLLNTTDTLPAGRGFLLEGRSIKIEVETTGGTVSALNARIKWAKIP